MISLLKCAALPSVSNIELDWKLPNERNVVLIPSQLPSLISVGERLCIYALLTGGKTEVITKTSLGDKGSYFTIIK